jgi:DNA gyrase subunit B
MALLRSLEGKRLNERHAHLEEIYGQPGTLRRRDMETPIYGPRDLIEAVFAAGRKGLSMQRYKGLGEMNPDQLWDTTLNRDTRTLLQVKVGEVQDADDISQS